MVRYWEGEEEGEKQKKKKSLLKKFRQQCETINITSKIPIFQNLGTERNTNFKSGQHKLYQCICR